MSIIESTNPGVAELYAEFSRTPFRFEDGKLIDPEGEATQYASDVEAMRAGIASYAAWKASQQVAA